MVARSVGVGILLSVAAVGASAQTYPLAETVQAGDCFRIRLDMKLAGELRIIKGGKDTPLKLDALAAHDFHERILAVNALGLASKSARLYTIARASITVADEKSDRALRAERRLCVAQRYKDQHLAYAPAGPLFQEEVELIATHFDTLFVMGLLPGKTVAVGDTWKVANAVAQAMCNFEGLTAHDLTGKLDEVTADSAKFTIAGTVSGIDIGALVKVSVRATGHFDLKARRLVALEWSQKDERDQGPASPASTMQTNVALLRQPIDTTEQLSDVALISVPDTFEPPASLTQIDFRDRKARYSLLHGREWIAVSQTENQAVFRLMERGDFVAQATITPWTPASPGKHLSPDDFKAAMNDTPGWEPSKVIQEGVVSDADGRWVYRLSAQGELDGLSVLQNFFLVAGPGGEQVVVAISLNPKQATKLGARDLTFVGNLEVPGVKK